MANDEMPFTLYTADLPFNSSLMQAAGQVCRGPDEDSRDGQQAASLKYRHAACGGANLSFTHTKNLEAETEKSEERRCNRETGREKQSFDTRF